MRSMKIPRAPWRRNSQKRSQAQNTAQSDLDRVDLQRATTDLQEKSLSRAPTFSKEFPGWRAVVVGGLSVVIVVLIINISTLIYASTRTANSEGANLLYEGHCSKTSSMFTGWHLLINVLGTLLLGASNACVQILAAPSREEVDHAHKLGKSLHVGVFGFINTRFVPWNRFIIIVLLSISSIPLHLVYNSVVYNSVAAYEYATVQATEGFLNGKPWGEFDMDNYLLTYENTISEIQSAYQSDNNQYVSLTTEQCIAAFRANFVTDYKSLILIGNSSTSENLQGSVVTNFYPFNNGAGLGGYLGMPTYNWMCGGSVLYTATVCNPSADDWLLRDTDGNQAISPNATDFGHIKISRCLAAPAPQKCTLSFNKTLMGVVIACNLVKLCCFFATMQLRSHRPLVTIGDAIASFLASPDQYTKARGPVSRSDLNKGHCYENDESSWIRRDGTLVPRNASVWHGFKWDDKRARKFSAASVTRWTVTITCCLLLLVTGLVLLAIGIHSSANGISWSLGSANGANIIGASKLSLIPAALSANLIQLLISNVYILYNGIFTCMLLSTEYCEFAKKAMALRVSNRLGHQRTTYWLSLPYRYAVPLMVSISMLHWFVSGSLFVVSVSAYTTFGQRREADDILTLGWSSGGVILSCSLGFALIVTILMYGCLRFPAGIPIASSNSRAISAACHRGRSEGIDTVLKPIQYGTFSNFDSSGSLSSSTDHGMKTAGFSSHEVHSLVAGEYYGGFWNGGDRAQTVEEEIIARRTGMSKDVQISVSDYSSMSIKQRAKPNETSNNLLVPEQTHRRRGSSVASVARSVLASTVLTS